MKRTITMWAMLDYKGNLVSIDNTRKELRMQVFSWKETYKKGYRCRKVKISWEE